MISVSRIYLDLEFSNPTDGLHVSQIANMAIFVLWAGMGSVVLNV